MGIWDSDYLYVMLAEFWNINYIYISLLIKKESCTDRNNNAYLSGLKHSNKLFINPIMKYK